MNEFRTDGYFSDDGYIHGCYRELSPVFQRFSLLLRGLACEGAGEDAAHCELGFGQGESVAIHAAANPGQYVATDFNPAHAAHAIRLARHAQCNARIYDDSFAQLLDRKDLPAFDSISLHGVWSWVDPANHRIILDFVARHLKPGGIFYVSYNCFPGWSVAYPLRQLLAQHDRYAAVLPGAAQRVGAAVQFAETLLAAGPLAAQMMPALASRLELTKRQPANYVAHEFLNRAWHCVYFTDMVDTLAAAKLDFAATALPLDSVDAVTLTPAGIAFLNGIAHPILREQMRDYFVNKQFRMDLFVRGARALGPVELRDVAMETRIVLEKTVDQFPGAVAGPLGAVALTESIFGPLKQALAARDYAPKSLSEISATVPEVALPQLLSACAILVGTGSAAPCHSDAAVQQVTPRCAALNAHLLDLARTQGDVNYLASPVTGTGVNLNRFQQLFLLARREGCEGPEAWARFTWRFVAEQGQAVVKDGRALATPDENLAELSAQAQVFATERLPILLALGVA